MLTPMYGREKDIALMSKPVEWPRWPLLPLKRSDKSGNGQIEVGVLYASQNYLTVVWLTTMFNTIDPDSTPKIVYDSYEAISDDGWVVD